MMKKKSCNSIKFAKEIAISVYQSCTWRKFIPCLCVQQSEFEYSLFWSSSYIRCDDGRRFMWMLWFEYKFFKLGHPTFHWTWNVQWYSSYWWFFIQKSNSLYLNAPIPGAAKIHQLQMTSAFIEMLDVNWKVYWSNQWRQWF